MSIVEKPVTNPVPSEKPEPVEIHTEVLDKTRRISLSRFSDLAGISRDTLVYYIKEGLITPAVTETNGYQYFNPDQLRTITFIKYMRRFGIHINEIKSMLSGMDTDGIYRILDSHSREIDEQIRKTKQALHFLDQLRKLIDFVEAHPADLPFLCNLKETHLYQTPIRFCHDLRNVADAAVVSDFLEFESSGLPEHLICCRIPEAILTKDNFCELMREHSEKEVRESILVRPAGTFACVIHPGDSLTIREMILSLKEYIFQQDMEPAGDAYVLNSAGFFSLTPSRQHKYLIEIPVRPAVS